ncbi:MAG: hypothetical protein EHM45_02370 [Desulfobacteraceae bacterium]|nr:MAG: hypothetical protein EHM45_02370 [Desulfobacteraceae bacterium]
MSLRGKFEDKIKKKELEIQEYENKMKEAKAYLQALQDAIKLLPRENPVNPLKSNILRPGSNIAKTYEFLKKTGKPMHVNDILDAIGKKISNKEKISLSGSLGWYVRRKEIFSRPAPNTFGLLNTDDLEEPPEDFGIDEKNEN